MKYIKKFNEKYHVNDDVKEYTKIVYNEIDRNISNLIKSGTLSIVNVLNKNYPNLFINDVIELRLGKTHGGINKPIIIDKTIQNLIITLTIDLDDKEKKQLKLLNNKIRETINHEFQHIIELYHSDGKLSKSWDFHKRLEVHKEKFKSYSIWMDICHFFYLSEEHELRSRTSQVHELLKNGEDLLNNDVYNSINFLSKVDGDYLLRKMFNEYNDFDKILNDFTENVLLKRGNSVLYFIKEIKIINKRCSKYKSKMLDILYHHKNPNMFIEECYDKDINYSEYLKKD